MAESATLPCITPQMKVANPDIMAVSYIFRNLREGDRHELLALRWDDDIDKAAAQAFMYWGEHGKVAYWGDEPVAYFGLTPLWPGVWSAWMMATDKFQHIGFGLTRYIKTVTIPSVIEAGCHRVEARSIEGHDVAHKWLEKLGGKLEGIQKGYGKNGEAFYTFVLELKPCVPHQ